MARHVAGIYEIRNTVNGRRYIGSTIRFRKRWPEHFRALRRNVHHSSFLQRSWNKYGEASFEFCVLLYCSPENLLMYEQALIDGFQPDYNSAPAAGSMLGYRHTAETRAKLSSSHMGRPSPRRGVALSDETKQRISEGKRGKKLGPYSAERRAKLSVSQKGKVITAEHRAAISTTLSGRSTGRGQLTQEQVREARRLRASGLGRIKISKLMGITPSAANAAFNGLAYGWVA